MAKKTNPPLSAAFRQKKMLASIDKIRAAIEDRYAYSEIGKVFGVSGETVARFAKKHGFYQDRTEERARKLSQTPEFVFEIQEQLYQGAKFTDLAAKYRVSTKTIQRFCLEHKMWQLTAEEAAHVRKERRREKQAAESRKNKIQRWEAKYQADQEKRQRKMEERIRQREA